MQDFTHIMSNGTAEQTMNLDKSTAGHALFNNTIANQNGAPNATNSFLLDPIFNDYYIEYVMLHKLQALTNNFTCQNCWQVLNFKRFFDEDHLCLKKFNVPGPGDQAPPHYVHHSNIGMDGMEEFKETRAMFDHGD